MKVFNIYEGVITVKCVHNNYKKTYLIMFINFNVCTICYTGIRSIYNINTGI